MTVAYERPWYKQFWVWFVIAIPALGLLFGLDQQLAQGTALAVTALSPSQLAVVLQAGSNKALTSLDLDQLPIGTLLQGKVLTNQPIPQAPGQPAGYRSLVSLLNSAQAGATLTIVAGHAFGERAPVAVLMDTLYVSIDLGPGCALVIPAEHADAFANTNCSACAFEYAYRNALW